MSEGVLNRPPVSAAVAVAVAEPIPVRRLRDLHPGWLAAVMGTAILAIATDANPGGVAVLAPAGHVIGVMLAVLGYGVGALVPTNLARAGQAVFADNALVVTTVSLVFATAIWGFGLWWLAIVVALLVRYLRTGSVPFHLGWWGFVFPLGAFTVATLTLARAWSLPAVDAFGALLYLGLLTAWAVAATRTVASMRSGQIWRR